MKTDNSKLLDLCADCIPALIALIELLREKNLESARITAECTLKALREATENKC